MGPENGSAESGRPAFNASTPAILRRLGSSSDVALIASQDELSLGAAWYRFFRAEEPGYGFVDQSIPDLESPWCKSGVAGRSGQRY